MRYLSNLAAVESMGSSGVGSYVFVAVMDGRTSDTCGGLNGQRFSVKDAEIGVNAPPMESITALGKRAKTAGLWILLA